MRVLFSGGRDLFLHIEVIEDLVSDSGFEVDVVIHGNANGFDRSVDLWARNNRLPVFLFNADWKSKGRAAGMHRNRQMLTDGKPDAAIIVPSRNSKGTWGMFNLCKEAGIKIHLCREFLS